MTVNDQIKERWDDLLRKGVLVVSGVTDDGEFEYNFDIEKLAEVDPALYREHMDEVDLALMELFVKGLVNLDFNEADIQVELTEKGRDWISAYLDENEDMPL